MYDTLRLATRGTRGRLAVSVAVVIAATMEVGDLALVSLRCAPRARAHGTASNRINHGRAEANPVGHCAPRALKKNGRTSKKRRAVRDELPASGRHAVRGTKYV
jgi:hypothetical protein